MSFSDSKVPLRLVRAIFDLEKMVSVSDRYLFHQPMDEKIKTQPLRFPAKENRNMQRALFDQPIVLQYDVKAKYRLISIATRVCIRSIDQTNSSFPLRLLFLFCLFQGHTPNCPKVLSSKVLLGLLLLTLFQERLSKKVHATITKVIVGGFDCTVLQRNLKE